MANDPHFFTAASGGESSATGLSLEEGVVLGNKYRLLRPAGFGGMGAVWVARNEATAAEVVVKVLVTARQGVDHEAIARFRREAHTAAQLYHRGIVRIFDLVELSFHREDQDSFVRSARSMGESPPPDALVLVMELLRGETLASHMDKKVRFSPDEALAIVLPLLSALAHAHAQGIVHRDLKPENVFLSVDPDGHVIPKILDFGISKLMQPAVPRITTDGAMLGTPSYMAPEQARGLPNVDARADVFAAGILLYECLAGENPFASGSYHSVVAAILERDPQPLKSASPEMWRVIRRALEKPPALRYADAGELASALLAAAQGMPAAASIAESSGAFPARPSAGDHSVPPAPFREPEPTSPSIHVGRMRRKRARATFGAIVAAASLATAAGLYSRSMRPRGGATVPPITPVPVATQTSVAPESVADPATTHAPTPATSSTPSPARIPPAAAHSGPAASAAPSAAPEPAPTAHARSTHPTNLVSSGGSHTKPPSPAAPPASAPSAPSPAPSASSSVVRDPGF